jgi:4-phytase/acid phosphatase
MQTTPMLTHFRLLLRAASRWRQTFSMLLCVVILSPSVFAQVTSTDAEELKLVVALFRHGVRSPEPGFNQDNADKHSKNKWPELKDWKVMVNPNECDPGKGWGYLTIHGQQIATGLGHYYGNYYKQGPWSNGFKKVYFWADAQNQRTRETAKALAQGFIDADIPSGDVKVDWLKPIKPLGPCPADLLFHSFEEGCGRPDTRTLAGITSDINKNWQIWTQSYKAQFDQLFRTLGCSSASDCGFKGGASESASPWLGGVQRKSLITWPGRFSYASSASEAFLLEYANNMEQVGWGGVDTAGLRKMLHLHEFFFDLTQRNDGAAPERNEPYLALVQGSNLVNEIFNLIHLKATGDKFGCPHAPPESQFVGLVGHDTNIAQVQTLLGLSWEFGDPKLPDDTKGLPANDALPAGALVFELRKRSQGWFVRIEYVTQSLEQMRKGSVINAFRLRVKSSDCIQSGNYCEMSLDAFNNRVSQSIGKGKSFLSKCDGNTQICYRVLPTPIRKKTRR